MLYKDSFLLRLVSIGPLVFIPLIVGVIYFFSIEIYSKNFSENVKGIENRLIETKKNIIKNKILNISDVVQHQKSQINDKLTQKIQNRVKEAYQTANNIYQKYKNQKSESEIKEIIKTAVESHSWNNGKSFIWIVDYNGSSKFVSKHLKCLEDKSMLNLQGAKERYIVKEQIDICKSHGEGFLYNTFAKQNSDSKKRYKQIAYVKALGFFDWYIGSAEDVSTANKAINKELLELIDHIDNVENHYIIVLDQKGNMLLNKSMPQDVGKNMFEIDSPIYNKLVKYIAPALEKNDSIFLTYDWINIKTNKIEKKHAYYKKIPGSDWVIGSGFYTSDIKEEVEAVKADMYDIYYKKSKYIIYLGILTISISFIISYYLSRMLRISLIKYEKRIKQKTYQLKVLNENLEQKVQDRTAQLEKLKNNFEELAITDSLTEMHNRYSIMQLLGDEVNRAHRYKTPLSIIMYDIDYFKLVNDTYGHKVGDDVLKALSNLVKKSIRDIDILGRYGGEEFLLLLPNTKLSEAENFAQRLIQKVDKTTFDIVGNITISIGLIEIEQDETVDEIFKRVDRLLYKSKEDGRNRVSV